MNKYQTRDSVRKPRKTFENWRRRSRHTHIITSYTHIWCDVTRIPIYLSAYFWRKSKCLLVLLESTTLQHTQWKRHVEYTLCWQSHFGEFSGTWINIPLKSCISCKIDECKGYLLQLSVTAFITIFWEMIWKQMNSVINHAIVIQETMFVKESRVRLHVR